MSLPPEILKKVKLLEINTRQMVNSTFSGAYRSAFRGQGLIFSDLREYVPGDDVRSISWPVMAKTGKPYIKKYEEEREMTLVLVVDVSGSSDFGSQKYFKGEAIAHLAAFLGFSANKNNDMVGLLLFSDQVELYVPPKKGRGQIHRILRELYYFEPRSRKTNLSSALQYLNSILKKRSNVFIFSDFFDQGFEKPLVVLGTHHDTVAVVIRDPAEEALPNVGLVDLHDAETEEVVTIDTSSLVFQRQYKDFMNQKNRVRDKELLRSQVERLDVNTQEDITVPLLRFFKKRGCLS